LKKRVYPRLRDLIESGAGFPIDQTIRAFALEFNDRALSHGSEVMPASFNMMEAFLFPERVEDVLRYFGYILSGIICSPSQISWIS
jgi:hypothetical protein